MPGLLPVVLLLGISPLQVLRGGPLLDLGLEELELPYFGGEFVEFGREFLELVVVGPRDLLDLPVEVLLHQLEILVVLLLDLDQGQFLLFAGFALDGERTVPEGLLLLPEDPQEGLVLALESEQVLPELGSLFFVVAEGLPVLVVLLLDGGLQFPDLSLEDVVLDGGGALLVPLDGVEQVLVLDGQLPHFPIEFADLVPILLQRFLAIV